MKYILIILLAFSAIGLQAQHVDFRGLARINPERLDVVSEFRITDGSGACFSHPTIFDGVLYVRHGTALIAYNIKR
jgi:hypothetical protein